MYVIVFYDIADRQFKEKDNSRRIRKTIEKYLPRVQYSVYEGELRASDFRAMTELLARYAEHELDSIVIYQFERMAYSKRTVIGQDKLDNLFT